MTGNALAIRDEPQWLATVEQVRALAEQCVEVGDAKNLADRARTLEVWARRAKLGDEKVQLAIAARVWSERRAGELLREMRENGERDPGGRGRIESRPATQLKDLGVSKHESSRWQKLAAIPEDEFERVAARTGEGGKSDYGLKSVGRHDRDEDKRVEREKAEAEARAFIAKVGDHAAVTVRGDVRHWRPAGVSCVITDPPYITADAVELHSALADFALDVLPPHGALAVMTWQPLLPDVLSAMARPRLVYRWTAAWTFGTSERTPERAPRVFDGWKPVLVFHKDGWNESTEYLYDVIVSRDADKQSHEWGQSVGGFRHLVRAFSQPGEVVCDPFVGGGTTAVAAASEARLFVGCDASTEAVETTNARLAA